MPKVSVDECPAGPALDAAVARVRGHEIVFDKNGLPYHARAILAGIIIRYVSPYSTDITEAWELLEEMGIPEATTVSLAIARAYLKAKGVEYVEVPE